MQYVYLLKAGDRHFKVGISHNVKSRVSGLQAFNPEHIDIVATKFADTDAYSIEQELHRSLEKMKAKGANEWFELTPLQALELAIKINEYPDIDVSERVTLAEIVKQQKHLLKQFDKKLDYVINTYQKQRPKLEQKKEPLAEKPTVVPKIEVPPRPTKQEKDKLLLQEAISIINSEQRASTSLLQRKLRIGYGRAAMLMEELEKAGFIGAADGARPRKLLEQSREPSQGSLYLQSHNLLTL